MAGGESTSRIWESLECATDGQFSPAVGEYFEWRPPDHQDHLAEALDMVHERSTPAFREATTVKVGVPVPISFQEDQYVGRSLELYGTQLGSLPFRVLGYLNWPPGTPEEDITKTQTVLDSFIQRRPDIPFAYFAGPTRLPRTIGNLRLLGSHALLPFLDEDALIVGQDADQEDMSPGHLLELFKTSRVNPDAAAILPHVSHTRVPELPRINNLIEWFDDLEAQRLCDYYFEPGPAVTVKDYMAVNGHDRFLKMSETHNLIQDIRQLRDPLRPLVWALGARLVLSPRRLIQKIVMGYGSREYWGSDFNAVEPYRGVAATSFAQNDISKNAYKKHLHEHIKDRIGQAVIAEFKRSSPDPLTSALNALSCIRDRLGGPADLLSLSPKNYPGRTY